MAGRLARLCTRSPRALLALLVLLTAGLGAYASGVPDRLALGGGELRGSQSEEANGILAAEVGYEPEPAFLVVLSEPQPLPLAAREVALEAVGRQIEAIAGVAAVVEGPAASAAGTTVLAVHLRPGLEPDAVDEVGDALRSGLDPGALELLVGGTVPTQQAARRTALDDAPPLLALLAPLLLVLLAGSLGLRTGLAAALGALLAAAGSVSLLGVIAELTDIQALAAIPAAFAAVVLGLDAAIGLRYRYREESATLKPGPEALEYALHTVLRGAAIGALSAALVGAGLLLIPIDFVESIGIAVIIAAVVGPTAGLIAVATAIAARPGSEVGRALPLVGDDDRARGAPRTFRALLAIGRSRRRGVLALLPLLAAAALAIAVLDAEAIGLEAAELPGDDEAARAAAEIAGSFGPGALGPLLVVTDGPAEAPTLIIYRDSILGLTGIQAVGRAVDAGPFASFNAVPDSRPQSLAAQDSVEAARSVAAPTPRRVGGPAAGLTDAAGRLADEGSLLGLLALLVAAALWGLLFRSAFGPLIAVAALLGPLAGIAAMVGVFAEGAFTDLLDYAAAGAPHLQSFVVVGAILLAVGLSRGAALATALREERVLGGGAAGSLARSATLTLHPAAVASLAGFALAAVWLGAELPAAKEISVGLAAGLAVDLLLARTLLAPALARLAL